MSAVPGTTRVEELFGRGSRSSRNLLALICYVRTLARGSLSKVCGLAVLLGVALMAEAGILLVLQSL